MKCAFHHDRDIQTQCRSCKKFICWDCSVAIEEDTYCKHCISKGLTKKAAPQSSYPYPYPYSYPYNYSNNQQTLKSRSKPIPKKNDGGIFVISGAMLLMVGLLGFLSPIIIFSIYLPSIPYLSGRDITAPIWIFICFSLPLIFSLFTVIGGLSALRRKNLPLAVMGSIFGMLSWGFFIGSAISFFVLLILIYSYKDFYKKTKRV
jgi:hypothetical protein